MIERGPWQRMERRRDGRCRGEHHARREAGRPRATRLVNGGLLLISDADVRDR